MNQLTEISLQSVEFFSMRYDSPDLRKLKRSFTYCISDFTSNFVCGRRLLLDISFGVTYSRVD